MDFQLLGGTCLKRPRMFLLRKNRKSTAEPNTRAQNVHTQAPAVPPTVVPLIAAIFVHSLDTLQAHPLPTKMTPGLTPGELLPFPPVRIFQTANWGSWG